MAEFFKSPSWLLALDNDGVTSQGDGAKKIYENRVGPAGYMRHVDWDGQRVAEGKTTFGKRHYPALMMAEVGAVLYGHGVTPDHMEAEAHRVPITPGVSELVYAFNHDRNRSCMVSAGYDWYAQTVAQRGGLNRNDVMATAYPREQRIFTANEESLVRNLGRRIEEHPDQSLKAIDQFVYRDMEENPGFTFFRNVVVYAAHEKGTALLYVAAKWDILPEHLFAIGDGEGDWKMVSTAGEKGIGVAFNASRRLLPHATIALAAPNLMPLVRVIPVLFEHGRNGFIACVSELQKQNGSPGSTEYWHVPEDLPTYEFESMAEVHETARIASRGRETSLIK